MSTVGGSRKGARAPLEESRVRLPVDVDHVTLRFGDRSVALTNLRNPCWRAPLITKGDLIQYYADVAAVLLPHLRDRAMVMKRYPNGSEAHFFFMKRVQAGEP